MMVRPSSKRQAGSEPLILQFARPHRFQLAPQQRTNLLGLGIELFSQTFNVVAMPRQRRLLSVRLGGQKGVDDRGGDGPLTDLIR